MWLFSFEFLPTGKPFIHSNSSAVVYSPASIAAPAGRGRHQGKLLQQPTSAASQPQHINHLHSQVSGNTHVNNYFFPMLQRVPWSWSKQAVFNCFHFSLSLQPLCHPFQRSSEPAHNPTVSYHLPPLFPPVYDNQQYTVVHNWFYSSLFFLFWWQISYFSIFRAINTLFFLSSLFIQPVLLSHLEHCWKPMYWKVKSRKSR